MTDTPPTIAASEIRAGTEWVELNGRGPVYPPRRRLRAERVEPGATPTIVKVHARNVATDDYEVVEFYAVNRIQPAA